MGAQHMGAVKGMLANGKKSMNAWTLKPSVVSFHYVEMVTITADNSLDRARSAASH